MFGHPLPNNALIAQEVYIQTAEYTHVYFQS